MNVQLCHSENNLGLGRGPNLDKEIGSMTDPDWSVSQVEWCWLVMMRVKLLGTLSLTLLVVVGAMAVPKINTSMRSQKRMA